MKATPSPPMRNLDTLTRTIFPVLRALIRAGYFSLEVEGAGRVPRSGAVVYAGNHAGWFTLDSIFGSLAVADHIAIEHVPWAAGEPFILKLPGLGRFFANAGVFPASWLRDPEALPPEMQAFCVYPEGAEGSCKSFLYAYQMRTWRTGFLRLALARNAKVVPVAVIGSEECLPVLATIRFLKPLTGTVIPLPLSLLPLPTRWKYIFHDPVDVAAALAGFADDDLETKKRRLRELAAILQERVQQTLDRETANHGLVRFARALPGGAPRPEAVGEE